MGCAHIEHVRQDTFRHIAGCADDRICPVYQTRHDVLQGIDEIGRDVLAVIHHVAGRVTNIGNCFGDRIFDNIGGVLHGIDRCADDASHNACCVFYSTN